MTRASRTARRDSPSCCSTLFILEDKEHFAILRKRPFAIVDEEFKFVDRFAQIFGRLDVLDAVLVDNRRESAEFVGVVTKLVDFIADFFNGALQGRESSGDAGGFRWDGEGFLLLAAFSYACSTVLIKRFSQRENPVTLSGWQFIIGGFVMAAVSFLAGGRLRPVSPQAWLLMLYLGLLSAVAYTLWSLLLQRHPVSHITVYSFANPVFGVILSALLLEEGKQLDVPRCLLSLLLVSLGVWIVNGGQKESGAKEPKAA